MNAKKKPIESEVVEPDFDRALKIMHNDVNKSNLEKSKHGKDESAAWKLIKDECHLSSPAAKFFNTHILGREDETRDNNLRTLYGLMKASGIGISADLVDQMGDGEAPTMPVSEEKRPTLATIDGGKED